MNADHVFLCGNPALDLAATLRARRTLRFEMLTSPERLGAWYLAAGIVDGLSPGCRESDVEQAVRVREAVYALVTARLRGEPYGDEALAVVNGAAGRPSAAPQLTASGRWTEATPAEALATVARHAVELLGGADTALLKECGDPECTRVHLDRSRGARRQWCGMESCGNRVKAAAYRARKKGTRQITAG
ncbi:ABATE domain-containing protein [Streptomyces phaeoluteigriseus]|uniref:ABATE domain-containing protein n=1 Tax=Streptomyces phaeoluteigriseus TaxID=114686 RepID=A0ABY4Z5D2_9ACTN|nr:CGNR zinc finger domain-containing protein [Streptomyces phaeoluteigriseus]USQ84181.1 ABATE domain-containing protein [Streptomyces phaeoluteigriseus]